MKALIIIAPKNFRDEELKNPKRVLEANGIKTTVVSTTRGTCTGMLGMKVTPDAKVGQVDAKEYDLLVLVGGTGSMELRKEPKVIEVVREFDREGKLIGAICVAPTILAESGVLNGKEATVWPSPKTIDILERSGATYVKKDIVKHRNIITAKGPSVAREFGQKLAGELK